MATVLLIELGWVIGSGESGPRLACLAAEPPGALAWGCSHSSSARLCCVSLFWSHFSESQLTLALISSSFPWKTLFSHCPSSPSPNSHSWHVPQEHVPSSPWGWASSGSFLLSKASSLVDRGFLRSGRVRSWGFLVSVYSLLQGAVEFALFQMGVFEVCRREGFPESFRSICVCVCLLV